MTILNFQIHHNTQGWLDAATLDFQDDRNVAIEYDLDYASEYFGHHDRFALSVTLPVEMAIHRGPMPGFILDLVPQGEPLKRILRRYGIQHDDNYAEILGRVPLASPGNIRVKEPWQEVDRERASYAHPGFSRDDIVYYKQEFVDYMTKTGAPIGGTSGAGGGSPKFLMREDHAGKFHADGVLDDAKTKHCYLIKFPYTDSSNSLALVETELIYYDILKKLPLITGDSMTCIDHVLFIKRFDRVRGSDGRLLYHGLESFYSAQNINVHGAFLRHEDNLRLIARFSSAAKIDIVEYLKRDLVNQILANSDNHGRNTAFLKTDQGIRLAPLYDVTAMKFFADPIIELTTWDASHRDLSERLAWVRQEFSIPEKIIKREILSLRASLGDITATLLERGVPRSFVERSESERGQTLKAMEALA